MVHAEEQKTTIEACEETRSGDERTTNLRVASIAEAVAVAESDLITCANTSNALRTTKQKFVPQILLVTSISLYPARADRGNALHSDAKAITAW